MPEYKVKQGDCLSSIASRHGLFWDKVWNHPKNAKLKEQRKDPNILYPGDVVFVPDKEKKEESGATEQKHRFRKKGVPEQLRLQLMVGDQPLANERYVLNINGRLMEGATDQDGKLEQFIPPNAKQVLLWIGDMAEEYALDLGHLDPVTEVKGLQARLKNLGYDCGPVDGILGPKTSATLCQFQKAQGLAESGKSDQPTRNALLRIYGS